MPTGSARDCSDRPPLRTVLLLEDLEFGGTQRHAVHLLHHLDRSLLAPEAWVLRDGTGMAPLALASGAPVHWLTRGPRVGTRSILRLALRLKRDRPDVLVTLTVIPNVWGRLLGRWARVPVIIGNYRGLAPRQLERWLWPLAARVLCNADAVRREMVARAGVDPRRIVVVGNGVALPPEPRPERRTAEPSLLFVGRLVPEKNPLGLLEAFRALLARLPQARLTMVGDGPQRGAAESYVRRNALDRQVALQAGTLDVAERYAQAWVLVLPSRSEASPNVILEAMAAGLPVVSTSVGGIPELVREGQTGALVPPGDAEALAQACLDLLRDDDRRVRWGRRARQIAASEHGLERMVRATETAILEAARERAWRCVASGPA